MTEIIVDVPEGHTLVCGWNGHALHLVHELEATGRSVTVVARRYPEELRDLNVMFVLGDIANDEILIRAGVKNASAAVILAEDAGILPNDSVDARSILSALAIESICPEIYSVIEILNPENERHAKNANVDNVVYCDRLIANYTALCASQRGISAFTNDLFSREGAVVLLAEDVDLSFDGKTIGELFDAIRVKGDLPMAVMRRSEGESREVWEHEINPPSDKKIALPMKAIVIHTKESA